MKFLVPACDCGQFYIFQVVYYPGLRPGLSVCAPFVFSPIYPFIAMRWIATGTSKFAFPFFKPLRTEGAQKKIHVVCSAPVMVNQYCNLSPSIFRRKKERGIKPSRRGRGVQGVPLLFFDMSLFFNFPYRTIFCVLERHFSHISKI